MNIFAVKLKEALEKRGMHSNELANNTNRSQYRVREYLKPDKENYPKLKSIWDMIEYMEMTREEAADLVLCGCKFKDGRARR